MSIKVNTLTSDGIDSSVDIEPGPGGFTLIVHDQGLRIDVPEFVEVNPHDTIECMKKMTQKQWEWISTGDIFKELWKSSFNENHRGGMPTIPQSINFLNKSDYGIIHIAGLITLGVEAAITGKNVFFRNPETYLHPSSEQMLADMLKKMLQFCGKSGTVTKTDTAPTKTKKKPTKKQQKEAAKLEAEAIKNMVANAEADKAMTLKWLNCMEPEKRLAKIGDKEYTVGELITEVSNNSRVGIEMIGLFVSLRDGR